MQKDKEAARELIKTFATSRGELTIQANRTLCLQLRSDERLELQEGLVVGP